MRMLFLANATGLLSIALAVLIFAFDLLTPQGFALGVLYLIPLLLSIRVERIWLAVGIASLCSVLIALDVVFGEAAATEAKIPAGMTVSNRCIEIGSLWFVLLLTVAKRRCTAQQTAEPISAQPEKPEDSSGMALWALIDASPLALITLDRTGCVRLWSPAAERIFGWQQAEVLGKPYPIVPWDMTHEFEDLLGKAARGEAIAGRETLRTRRDGAVINVSLSTALMRGVDQEVISIVEMIEDITDRKRAEAERLSAREELEDRLQRDAKIVEEQLNKARRELVASTRLMIVGQMTAQLAHDLRNPLGSIRNAAYYLSRRVPQGDVKWTDYLNMIRDEVETCNRIITSLLDVTRGRQVVPQRVELEEMISQAVARQQTPEAVELQFECLPSPFEINADPMQLRQVLDNLLKNAIDAVGIAGRIEIRALRPSDCETDVITVSDTGPGIPTHLGESVFDLFVTTKSKGTGLGLAICRQIVERHGGRIAIANERGAGGAVFRIDLPRINDPIVAVSAPAENLPIATKTAS